MNKFDPDTVPLWCRWIAVDDDGECMAYENKPIKTPTLFKCWYRTQKDTGAFGKLYKGKPPKNWEDELYTWG